MVIKTNYQSRPILTFSELTEKEREQFDYFDSNFSNGNIGAFVRYKRNVYDLDDVDGTVPEGFKDWDTYISDSFFSGVLFKYLGNHEEVICGRYYT